MTVLYFGDYIKGNGPSSVDIELRKHLGDLNIFYQQSNQKPNFALFKKFMRSNFIHVSGVSFLGMLFIVLGRLLGKSTSYTMHGYLKNESKFREVKSYRLWIEKIILKYSKNIIVVSEQMKALVQDPSKVIVIPNGVNFIKNHADYTKKKLITLIGGGRPEKQHLKVCEIIDELNREGYDLQVNLFGESGVESRQLEKFSFVKNFGFASKVMLSSSLEVSLIFIQYSSWESFSLSVADAINYQCKVITSEFVGINDYIKPNEFYKIAKNDQELKEILKAMLDMEELNYIIPQNCLLSWESVAQKYRQVWCNE